MIEDASGIDSTSLVNTTTPAPLGTGVVQTAPDTLPIPVYSAMDNQQQQQQLQQQQIQAQQAQQTQQTQQAQQAQQAQQQQQQPPQPPPQQQQQQPQPPQQQQQPQPQQPQQQKQELHQQPPQIRGQDIYQQHQGGATHPHQHQQLQHFSHPPNVLYQHHVQQVQQPNHLSIPAPQDVSTTNQQQMHQQVTQQQQALQPPPPPMMNPPSHAQQQQQQQSTNAVMFQNLAGTNFQLQGQGAPGALQPSGTYTAKNLAEQQQVQQQVQQVQQQQQQQQQVQQQQVQQAQQQVQQVQQQQVQQQINNSANPAPNTPVMYTLHQGPNAPPLVIQTTARTRPARSRAPRLIQQPPTTVQQQVDHLGNIKPQPTYVNAKQYGRILKRRQVRQMVDDFYAKKNMRSATSSSKKGGNDDRKAEGNGKRKRSNDKSEGGDPAAHQGADGDIGNHRRSYMHESRHKHAMKRPRGPGGRFLTKDELKEYYSKHPEQDPSGM